MTKKPKVVLSWSTGKDSARSLYVLRQQGNVEIVGLFSSLTGTDNDRKI